MFLPAARADLLEGLPIAGQVTLGSDYNLIDIADGGSDGALLTVSITDAFEAALGDVEALAGVVNQDAQAAEENLPEGANVVLTMTGWTLPVIGSVGSQAANAINTAWQQGQIPFQPWSGNAQIAYYDSGSDAVTCYWIKGQAFLLYAVYAIIAVLVVAAIVGVIDGLTGKNWSLEQAVEAGISGNPPSGPKPGGIAGWWDGLSFFAKAGIIAGGVGALAGTVIYLGKLQIAKAGAGRSTINIVEPGGTLGAVALAPFLPHRVA